MLTWFRSLKYFTPLHSKEYILVKLRESTVKSSLEYTPGDHIAVFPENSANDVDLICKRVTLPDGVNADTIIRLLTSKASHVPGLLLLSFTVLSLFSIGNSFPDLPLPHTDSKTSPNPHSSLNLPYF